MPANLPNGISYKVEIQFAGDAAFTDVTDKAVSVDVARGRSVETDEFRAGSAVIVLRNNSREFDPLNTAGTYYGKVVPRIPVRITAGSTQIFNGYIYDWNYDYDPPNPSRDISLVSVSCIDAFSILGEQLLTSFTPTSQGSGARVTAILDRSEVSWPAGLRDIKTGSSTLGTQPVAANTNVLDYLQQVAASEQGFLFVAGDGKLTFLGRNDVVSTTVAMTFSDDGTNTKYNTFEVSYGAELLYNRVVVNRSGGSSYTKTNATSIGKYLTKTLDVEDLLVSTDAQAENIANNLLSKYAEPELRFSQLSTVIEANAAAFTNVIGLEIGDTVEVKKSFKTGAPSSVTRPQIVQGLAHRITAESHTVTVNLGTADQRNYLRLNDPVYGRLNLNLLGW